MIELMTLHNKDNFGIAKSKFIKQGFKNIELREKWMPPKNKVNGFIKYSIWGSKS